MSICKDCIHYEICDEYVSPCESFPETDGCKCFKDKTEKNGLILKVGGVTGYFPKEFIAEAIETHISVVRCKDCKHARKAVDGYYHCRVDGCIAHNETDYCSCGERREE